MTTLPPHVPLLHGLLQTEKAYTHDLFTIISRIAAAYTPTDLPPRHLDHHFRLIESIFRFHKTFQQHPMPSAQQPSIGPLIHLFASIVHQLLPVYARYCHPTGWGGMGGWSRDPMVNSNSLLVQTLHALEWPHSLHHPQAGQHYAPFPEAPYPVQDLVLYDAQSRPHATLTVFFSLPFTRLVYYKKLSFSLLQLVPPGRPEHQTVFDCSHQLSVLLDRGRAQWNTSPLQLFQTNPQPSPQQPQPPQQPQHLPNRQPPDQQRIPRPHNLTIAQPSPPRHFSPVQALPSNRQSPVPNSFRASSETSPSTLANSSLADAIINEVFDRNTPSTLLSSPSATSQTQQPIESSKSDLTMVPVNPGVFIQKTILDLQTQLDTSRCLDIFTMAPKQCRLHLAPPTLAYSRSIRYSGEARFKVQIQAKPNQTQSGTEINDSLVNGRLILITDLLIFCEYQDQSSPNPNQLSLMYPPLAGKHLQVSPVLDDSTFSFDVTAMNKSVVRVFVSNLSERDTWVHHLRDAFEFCRQIVLQKQATNSAVSPQSTSPVDSCDIDSSNINQNKPSKLSPISHLTIKKVGANQGIQSQPISPSFSHDRIYDLQQSHKSSSSIQLDQQLSQLNLSQISQFHSNFARKGSAPSTPILNHAPSLLSNSDSVGCHIDHLPSPSSSLRVKSGFSEQPLRSPVATNSSEQRSPVATNSSEQRNSQDRAPSPHRLRKMPSAHALGAHNSQLMTEHPPMPMRPGHIHSFDPRMPGPGSMISMHANPIARSTSTEPYTRHYRPPSVAVAVLHKVKSGTTLRTSNLSQANDIITSSAVGSDEQSPDSENEMEKERNDKQEAESKTVLVASLKTKVFKKQSHSQWKSLGAGKIQVFLKNPGNCKQLVVFDIKNQSKVWISTIVLSDGVERVGRTGVAVDLSDHGARTGIVYMLQMKNETSAHGLFEQLLEGSDRRPK